MVMLPAARDLSQDDILATKSRFGRPPKTTKHTDDFLRRKLRKNHHLSASELKEMHADHLGNVSIRCIQHSLQKDLNIPSRRAASKPLLTPHMKNKCLQFAFKYIFTGVLMTGKGSCRLMNEPFRASPGHLGAIIAP